MSLEMLFPVPLQLDQFHRPLSVKESHYSKTVSLIKNTYNRTSSDFYVLKDPILQELNSWLDSKAKKFFYDIYSPSGEVELYITQSWFNHSSVGDQHHAHNHPNSIISGVFYFDADPEIDRIVFFKPVLKAMHFTPVQFNGFNSDRVNVMVWPGQLTMFPSSLIHAVDPVLPSLKRETRVSLSFNTFVRGHINPGYGLSELILQ